MRTIDAQLEDIIGKKKTVEEIMTEGVSEYGVKFFDCETDAEAIALDALKKAYDADKAKKEEEKHMETKEVETKEETILCTCGHEVKKTLVMSTSTGSSCPDCYDRMSI